MEGGLNHRDHCISNGINYMTINDVHDAYLED